VRRQLQDHVRTRRGKVKTHEGPPHGTITALHPDQDYGLITTPEGREIYFHRNSVLNADFNSLTPGIEVRFSEEAGDEGPQASSVHVLGGQL
jgi:cold shock CspA family protein